MNKRQLLGLIVVVMLALFTGAAASVERGTAEQAQLLVMLHQAAPHYRPGAPIANNYGSGTATLRSTRRAKAVAKKFGLSVVEGWPMPALSVHCFVMATQTNSVGELLERIEADPRVESAQSMQQFHTIANNDRIKSDPFAGLQRDGSGLDLALLHSVTTGSGIRVAQIDTGVDLEHPDLIDQIELARNFVDDRPIPNERHGTAVAGVMVARAGNGVGTIGVAPAARLLILRACWESEQGAGGGLCNSFTIAKALQFVLKHDVKIINLSLAGPSDRLLQRLIDVAFERGIVVVGAFDEKNPGASFPAAHPGVITVAHTQQVDLPQRIIRAPGQNVLTTLPGGRWGFVSGSSIATAHVSGLVALIFDLKPSSTQGEIIGILTRSSMR